MANRLISFISPPPSETGDLAPRLMLISPALILRHEWRMITATIGGPPDRRQAASPPYRTLRRLLVGPNLLKRGGFHYLFRKARWDALESETVKE